MIKKRRTKGEGMEWHGREYLRITYGPVVFWLITGIFPVIWQLSHIFHSIFLICLSKELSSAREIQS